MPTTPTSPHAENYAHIPGWGIDADPRNDPTYPMKARNNGEHAGYTWARPPQQITDVEVLHSNERPNLSATFGAGEPPSGLSGMLRRNAFRYSESNPFHWVTLLLADRVDMAEGVLDDFRQGHVPNIAKERGWPAEWKHDRTRFVWRAAVATAVAAATVAYLRRGRRAD